MNTDPAYKYEPCKHPRTTAAVRSVMELTDGEEGLFTDLFGGGRPFMCCECGKLLKFFLTPDSPYHPAGWTIVEDAYWDLRPRVPEPPIRFSLTLGDLA